MLCAVLGTEPGPDPGAEARAEGPAEPRVAPRCEGAPDVGLLPPEPEAAGILFSAREGPGEKRKFTVYHVLLGLDLDAEGGRSRGSLPR